MRLVGTGKAPEGRYPEGHVFDSGSVAESQDLLDRGWAKRLAPEDDPSRTQTQIANAAVRGDSLADPVDRKIAEEEGYIDEGGVTAKAYGVVHSEDPSADEDEPGIQPGSEPEHREAALRQAVPSEELASVADPAQAYADAEGPGASRSSSSGKAADDEKASESGKASGSAEAKKG